MAKELKKGYIKFVAHDIDDHITCADDLQEYITSPMRDGDWYEIMELPFISDSVQDAIRQANWDMMNLLKHLDMVFICTGFYFVEDF